MHILEDIFLENYTYQLPENRIAKYPLEERDNSKLLIYNDRKISHGLFYNLDQYLTGNSHLIFNNTKVIQARITFEKETGARIEIFCLEPDTPSDYSVSFQCTQKCSWKCMVGNAKKWKSSLLHKQVTVNGTQITLYARKIRIDAYSEIIEFEWDGNFSFSEVLESAGMIPIPPYLNREPEISDYTRYQTVYSKIKGSVAAPTAGLHFTKNVFDRLTKKDIHSSELTLHVGAGTFKPIKANNITGHEMHTEFFSIDKKTITALAVSRGNIIAVGTTSARALESLYWAGSKLHSKKNGAIALSVSQWEPYKLKINLSVQDALSIILEYMEKYNLDVFNSATSIMIVPGYRFQMVKGLITNYHLPKSTLILLIAAFIGEDWKKVYQYALDNDFRFLSYGDSSLLFPC